MELTGIVREALTAASEWRNETSREGREGLRIDTKEGITFYVESEKERLPEKPPVSE